MQAPVLPGAATAALLLLLPLLLTPAFGDDAAGGGGGGGSYRSEMRSALSTIAAIIRAVAEKLERHELRERQLGDQLRRGQQTLEKRLRAGDAALANVSDALARQDLRLGALEQRMMQGQEEASSQLRECQLAAAAAANSASPAGGSPGDGAGAAGAAEVGTALEAAAERLERATQALDKATRSAGSALAHADAQARALDAAADRLVARLESATPAPVAATAVGSVESDWHALFLSALEAQGAQLRELSTRTAAAAGALTAAQAAGGKLGSLRIEMEEANNATLFAVETARARLSADADKATAALQRELTEARAAADRARDDLLQALSDQAELADRTADRNRAAYEELHKQVVALRSAEPVLLQTADNVLDTKRGLEYGVHQILLQTDQAVQAQGKLLNATLHARFDAISGAIMQHQTGALANLSSKIENEISQVWRQIGIMYQQLTASASALDRLQAQTDSYVNGSAAAMDSMEGKVGAIRERMNEVDENLNYLLGKLSLFSSEFGQVRTGLGEALDSIRATFLEAQEAIRAAGPGPNPIPPDPHDPILEPIPLE